MLVSPGKAAVFARAACPANSNLLMDQSHAPTVVAEIIPRSLLPQPRTSAEHVPSTRIPNPEVARLKAAGVTLDTLVRVVIARRVQWANSSLRMGLTNVFCVVQLNIFRKGVQYWRVSVCLVPGIQLQIRAVNGSPSASAGLATLDYPTREIVLHVRGARTRMSWVLLRVWSVKRASTPRILGP